MAQSDPRSVVRKISGETELEKFVTLIANAYPVNKLHTEDARQRFKERLSNTEHGRSVELYGLFREGELLGGMRLFDFNVKLFSAHLAAGGVGMVAVDLQHKKEKVARDLILYFLDHYRNRGASLAMLYPFRPDFYHNMGFGYGTPLSTYRVSPATLPGQGHKERVRFLTRDEDELLGQCYARYRELTNGLIERRSFENRAILEAAEQRVVGYFEEETLRGYLTFSYRQPNPDNFALTELVIREMVYESQAALYGLLAFLNSQSDQISKITFYTQDPNFHYLFSDPRNGNPALAPLAFHETNLQGTGIMYRVINTPAFFQELDATNHDFGGQTLAVKFTLRDDFFPTNQGDLTVRFEAGQAQVLETESSYDVSIGLGIAEFSSLVVGAVQFKELYRYGLAEVSDPAYLEKLNRLFHVSDKPICFTAF